MLRFTHLIIASVIALFTLNVYAQDTTTTTVVPATTTVVERGVITTPAPKAVCKTVPAHWEGDMWADTHSECSYTNRPEGVVWVDSYWSCSQASADGTCTTWTLVPGRWLTTTVQQ